MIKKLYKLKKSQTDLKVLEKSQLVARIKEIENKTEEITIELNTASVDRYGAISDFVILQMHKTNLKNLIKELNKEKEKINQSVEKIDIEIVELQKESEKFNYLVGLEKKELQKRVLKADEESSSEYIQSRY